MTKLGIIPDTHGLLRPEVLDLFRVVDLIVHAGDIGSEQVLKELEKIAPVHAVKGNVDTGSWTAHIPERAQITVDRLQILLTHQVAPLDGQPNVSQVDVIIVGHSHKPSYALAEKQARLNPGSAGRQRFRLPVSLVLADVQSDSFSPTFINLLTGKPFDP